jgi:hypothetical protein
MMMNHTATKARSAIVDPTGASVGTDDVTLAPRRTSLAGVTLGLLDNGKVNGGVLLDELGRALAAADGVADVITYVKPYAGQPLVEPQLSEIAEACDVVVTAIGDCGSCSAATVADGILLERRGVPTASVVTPAFELSAAAMAQGYGFPGYRFATTAHPVASLDQTEVTARIPSLRAKVLEILGIE